MQGGVAATPTVTLGITHPNSGRRRHYEGDDERTGWYEPEDVNSSWDVVSFKRRQDSKTRTALPGEK